MKPTTLPAILFVCIATLCGIFAPRDVFDTPGRPFAAEYPTAFYTNTPRPLATASPTPAVVTTSVGFVRIEAAPVAQGAVGMLELLVIYAIGVNRLTDVIKKSLVEPQQRPAWLTLLASLIIGVGVALAMRFNLVAGYPAAVEVSEILAVVASGLVIGAASNFTHTLTELNDRWKEVRPTLPESSAPNVTTLRDAA